MQTGLAFFRRSGGLIGRDRDADALNDTGPGSGAWLSAW